jgi:hypothetical protein
LVSSKGMESEALHLGTGTCTGTGKGEHGPEKAGRSRVGRSSGSEQMGGREGRRRSTVGGEVVGGEKWAKGGRRGECSKKGRVGSGGGRRRWVEQRRRKKGVEGCTAKAGGEGWVEKGEEAKVWRNLGEQWRREGWRRLGEQV